MKPILRVTAGAVAILLIAGCKATIADYSANYKAAIDAYYDQSPACLWPQPVQFPMQVAASGTDKTATLSALVDEGLLTRSTSEKRVVVVSKREINYDLSNKGRSNWTADPSQPGYGNFCYGHRTVSHIVSATSNNDKPGSTSTVTYSYTFSGIPLWAKATELQAADPQLGANISSNGTATVTLTDTPNGWKMPGTPPADATGINNSTTATSSDGKIVR